MIDSGQKLFGYPIQFIEPAEKLGGNKNLPAVTVDLEKLAEAFPDTDQDGALPPLNNISAICHGCGREIRDGDCHRQGNWLFHLKCYEAWAEKMGS